MILNYISLLPLPVLYLLLPLVCALLILGLECIRYIFTIRHRKPVELGKRTVKIIFLTTILIEMALSLYLWLRFQNTNFTTHVLSSTGWTMTLTDTGNSAVRSYVMIDVISSTLAVISSFVALVACSRALADKENLLTAKKTAFFLLTFCGTQGILLSGGLFNLFIFSAISQIGASGLAQQGSRERADLARAIGYFVSRFLLLLMLFIGIAMLAVKYDVYNIFAISSAIRPGGVEKMAFSLIATPFLYLFIKPPIYTTDSASRCYFAIRAHAAFFALFRVVFVLTGVMSGFERISALIVAIGIFAVLTSLMFISKEREPIRFAAALESTLKGFMLVALGICLSGAYSAATLADYGYGALEAQISLLFMFLPLSAALSISAIHLRQEVGGRKLWLTGGHSTELGYTGLLFALTVCGLSGLPPTVVFASHQFLYRSANAINPFLMLVLFTASIFILFAGLRYIMMILFGGRSVDIGVFRGDSAITLPLLLLFLMIMTTTATPGLIYEKTVLPSVNHLVDRIRHVGSESSAQDIEDTGGEESLDESGVDK